MIAELNDFSNRLRAMGHRLAGISAGGTARSGIASRPSSTETQNCTPISTPTHTKHFVTERLQPLIQACTIVSLSVLHAAGSVRLRRKVGRAKANVNGRGRHGRLQHDTLCRGRRRLVK